MSFVPLHVLLFVYIRYVCSTIDLQVLSNTYTRHPDRVRIPGDELVALDHVEGSRRDIGGKTGCAARYSCLGQFNSNNSRLCNQN